MKRILVGVIVIAIGVIMLLHKLDLVDFSFLVDWEWKKFIVPAVIILVGLRILMMRSHVCKSGNDCMKEVELGEIKEGEIIKGSVAFSVSRYNLNEQLFNGADLEAFCGGITLDLSGAEIADKCSIKVQTMMGGVEIKAPSNVRFVVSSECILGGVDNKHNENPEGCTKTIYLKANCFLGGVDIK